MSKNRAVETLFPNRFKPVHSSRALSERRDTEAMAQTFLGVVDVVVRDGGVRRHTVVPKSNRSLFPPQTYLEVLTLRDVLHTKAISVTRLSEGTSATGRENRWGVNQGRERARTHSEE